MQLAGGQGGRECPLGNYSFVCLRNLRLAAPQDAVVRPARISVSPALGVHLSFGDLAFLGFHFAFASLSSARCSVLPTAQVNPPRRSRAEKDRR